jgi:RHH-type proline utilization regulon transcriptional repressor/proline dehydrogenase/delta 1-pyrroline-5-carboxylate dehydrogenase
VLRQAAAELERRRADLVEVMAAECGKTVDQADPEVSEAIDFAAYYADRAEELDRPELLGGARPVPVGLTVVTPPWNFPVAIPAGSTLAALAAGSPVVVKPAPQAQRCGSVMVEALWQAGVPRDALQLAHCAEGEVGRRLVAHPAVARLILTGAYETAELFRSFRPDLPLLAETSGKNAIVVTPSADLDLAVRDLVQSAFGHAGQKCSAASLAILVGPVVDSRRFHDQLVDAVGSLRVGWPQDPTCHVGPLIEPARGKLLDALTTLQPGESWLVEPRRLDSTGRLWSPGVKTGVRAGSPYHLTECFGPVLGLMSAATLAEAIALQNGVDYGLTAGLHSLDHDEIRFWLDRVEAGNLYVNRGITGAIVQRQPFGGWKRSVVGAGTKAGGPSYLLGLTDWAPATLDDGFLERAVRSDEEAWRRRYGVAADATGLDVERNWLRHLPVPVTVRWEGGSPLALQRVLLAGRRAGSAVTLSTPGPVEAEVAAEVAALAGTHVVEDADAWRARLRGPDAPHRVRLLGGDRVAFAEASGGRADIALYDHVVTESGRVELLPFLREQAISATAHRFGSPTDLVEGLV